MKIEDLLVEHNYYCSDSCWNSNEDSIEYDTWQDFLDEYENVDLDYNLVFRWDMHEEEGDYRMEVFVIQQRRGKFVPIQILNIKEEDVESIEKMIRIWYDNIKQLWKPFN